MAARAGAVETIVEYNLVPAEGFEARRRQRPADEQAIREVELGGDAAGLWPTDAGNCVRMTNTGFTNEESAKRNAEDHVLQQNDSRRPPKCYPSL